MVFPALAGAQSFEASVSGGALVIPNQDLGSGYALDNGLKMAVRATVNPSDHRGCGNQEHNAPFAWSPKG
jgi:hypothetical protein